jgi:hypothetical protein
MDDDFPARMTAARDAAMRDRNKGIAVGAHASWNRKSGRHLQPYSVRSREFAAVKAGYRQDLHFWRNPELLEWM